MTPKQKTARVTIKTVAEDAGVSVAAVSKVLRDAYGVSEALRGRVTASIERLRYRPHAAARGMRGQTYTLGVLLPDLRNPFFADIMTGVNEALERTQYQPLLGIGQAELSHEHAIIEAMIDRQMDGLILVAPRFLTTEVATLALRIPIAVIGEHTPDATTFDSVNNDDELGGALAVHHFSDAGYRNIACFSLELPPPGNGAIFREAGYRKAMAELGLSRHIRVIHAPSTAREVQVAARHLLEQRNRPDAIFCWTDFVAFEVLSIARELGLSVPGDVAVMGYDNTTYCDLAQNALTSIDQSGQLLGLQAARLLIERIKGREKAEHFVVTPRLVARASSRRSP